MSDRTSASQAAPKMILCVTCRTVYVLGGGTVCGYCKMTNEIIALRAELAALREPESVVSPDRELREAIEEVLSRGHTAAYDLRNDIHAVLSSPTSVGGET